MHLDAPDEGLDRDGVPHPADDVVDLVLDRCFDVLDVGDEGPRVAVDDSLEATARLDLDALYLGWCRVHLRLVHRRLGRVQLGSEVEEPPAEAQRLVGELHHEPVRVAARLLTA